MKFFFKRIKKKITIGFFKRAGKNSFGRKTICTQSGGYKLRLYSLDFKRNLGYNSILLSIEKNVNFTAFLGLIVYANGCFCYIILAEFMKEILLMMRNFFSNYKLGANFLCNIPTGNFIHNIELIPNTGAKISRAAGTGSFIINRENGFSFLKLKSGWLYKISDYCVAVFGKVSNENHFVTRLKNAGKNRKLGFRPHVRGVAKNPVDHAHGVEKDVVLRLVLIVLQMVNIQNHQQK